VAVFYLGAVITIGHIASSKCIVAFAENPGCCGKLLNFIDSVVPFRPQKSHLYFGLPFPYERPIVWHFKYSIDLMHSNFSYSSQLKNGPLKI